MKTKTFLDVTQATLIAVTEVLSGLGEDINKKEYTDGRLCLFYYNLISLNLKKICTLKELISDLSKVLGKEHEYAAKKIIEEAQRINIAGMKCLTDSNSGKPLYLDVDEFKFKRVDYKTIQHGDIQEIKEA